MRSKIINQPLKNRYMFLRHGETEANHKKMYMGRQDVPLTLNGIKQAKNVKLPATADLVYSSPLGRTMNTAKVVLSGSKLTVTKEPRLIEKSGGEIEGMTYAAIAEAYPEHWGIWDSKSLERIIISKFPGGECDLNVVCRLERFLAELELQHTNKTILFVTHSGVMQAARYLFGKSKEEIYLIPIPNCALELYE